MTRKTLAAPPSLVPLYARAGLTGPLHRGAAVPDSVYRLPGQVVAAEHLAAYQRVCGFRVADELPPTYLHVLAFPLSLALMSERRFPIPLVGMVHVANSITVSRPVHADEVVSLTVRAGDLRPHALGRQFDLLAEADVDGEIVWTGRSTYLRRGKRGEESERLHKVPPAGTGAAARPACLVRVPGDIGRRYGAVSGDRNPIHLHPLVGRVFGFDAAIAHGMWLKARTLAALEGRLPEAYRVEVAFKLPVKLPSTVAVAAQRTESGWSLDVRDSRSHQPHLRGDITALIASGVTAVVPIASGHWGRQWSPASVHSTDK